MSENKSIDDVELKPELQDGITQPAFDDSELMDIMAEIESLEKEFVPPEAQTPPEELVVAMEEVSISTLQESIDQEVGEVDKVEKVEDVAEISPEISQTPETPESNEGNVTFLRPEPTTPTMPAPSGAMELGLNFKIGEKNAHLELNGRDGFVLKLDGVELFINEASGCTIKMAGGATFNLPITYSDEAKKVA